jgi:hypothetical protein
MQTWYAPNKVLVFRLNEGALHRYDRTAVAAAGVAISLGNPVLIDWAAVQTPAPVPLVSGRRVPVRPSGDGTQGLRWSRLCHGGLLRTNVPVSTKPGRLQ